MFAKRKVCGFSKFRAGIYSHNIPASRICTLMPSDSSQQSVPNRPSAAPRTKDLTEENFGYNPKTNHFVRKDGPIWKRLVKNGDVQDPEAADDHLRKLLAKRLSM